MKTFKSLLVLLLFAACHGTGQAQLLKRLEKKVTTAAVRSADKAADKAVDNTVSKASAKTASKEQDTDIKTAGAISQPGTGTTALSKAGGNGTVSTTEEPLVITGGAPPKAGDACTSTEELATMPGKYLTAEEYPWPAARAEYFKKMTTAPDKATAKQTLEQIQKLEQQSRSGFTLAGGFWEAYYSTEGYDYFAGKKLADYRFQTAFYIYLCVKNKVERNDEYSTVLRVYVNSLPVNTLSRYIKGASKAGSKYDYKDWKGYKPGVAAPAIDIFTYLECNSKELISAINSGKEYWQDIPANEIRKDSYDHIYRYWFVKKADAPILLPVTRKEYLESLLEFYDREEMYIPTSTNYEMASKEVRQNYFGDIAAVLSNKRAIVNKVLKESSAEWLSRQAVVNTQEDQYLNQKQKLPEYSSNFTFHKFYDNEKEGGPLYKYNPAYFSGASQNAAAPEFMTIAFRYVSKPAHLRLINNFTDKFDRAAWTKLIQ